MLFLDTYHSTGNVYEMPEFVNFILKENGTYLNSILFPSAEDKVTSHNPIFAFILHTDSCDAWVTKNMNYQVTICYDLKFLDVHADSSQYAELVSIFQNIMQCKVNLMPFSSFERAVGIYTKMLEILVHQPKTGDLHFCATFRRETSSMPDMHLHLVLQRFLNKRAVDDVVWRCEAKQNWSDFFSNFEHLYWYHDYVMCVVDAVQRDGYSMSNVQSSILDVKENESQTPEELAIIRAKQSLLDLLKKAYKYTLK
jgi:hypothetical protein